MRTRRNALLLLTALAALTAASIGGACAQGKNYGSGGLPGPGPGAGQSPGPSQGNGGYRGGGLGVAVPGIIMTIPRGDDRTTDGVRPGKRSPPPQRATRQGPSGGPPAGDGSMVPGEVLVEVPDNVSAQALNAIGRRHRLTLLERQSFQFSGSTLIRWRIPDRRSVAAVVRELESDSAVASVQPNYLYTLQQSAGEVASEGDPMQYELAKLQLAQAHTLAKGDNVLVAVVDTGVTVLAGDITRSLSVAGHRPSLL
jgi:hypothetical protein